MFYSYLFCVVSDLPHSVLGLLQPKHVANGDQKKEGSAG